ncbi:hypothetical protein Ddc_15355 [Ditylenchus destructor]|nr:hypothetical protein Ddc_15355 [Ditylenchus destructor]
MTMTEHQKKEKGIYGISKLCKRIKDKISFQNFTSLEMNDPEDPKKFVNVQAQIQKMERLEKKLADQKWYCVATVAHVAFIVAIYCLMWYFFQCSTLPFQESPCKQTGSLPFMVTNQSTLADAVDEFTFALRDQIAKLHNAIEMPNLSERRALSNVTLSGIGQLFSDHYVDMAGFGSIKQEDERLKSVEEAIDSGYAIIYFLFFPMIVASFVLFVIVLVNTMKICKNPAPSSEEMLTGVQTDGNLQRTRLKHLKRRTSLLYIAIFGCIAAEVTLLIMLTVSQYYSGNVSVLYMSECNEKISGKVDKRKLTTKSCPFTDYLSFSTRLQTSLNKHTAKLDDFMASSLDARQTAWMYEIDAINTLIATHIADLEKYDVERRTMPRKIGNILPSVFSIIIFPILAWFVIILVFLVIMGKAHEDKERRKARSRK